MGRDDYGGKITSARIASFESKNNSSDSGAVTGSNVEMASLAQNASSFGQGDPNAILNECRSIDQGIDQIEQNLNQLRMLQDRSLNDADTSGGSSTSRQLDALSSDTMSLYRELTERVRQVKSSPDARQPKNSPQVGRIDRRLKQAIQQFQQVESAFRKRTQDQMARQYRIVRPDAPESEVRAAVEDVSGQGNQVFQQAMMQSSRQGQARAVLNAVQDRHAALQRIEQQMIELAQLFQDMDTLIVQQEVAVTQIEQKGEEVVENLDKGNEEIAVAVTTARKTRKKKWICLGIVGKLTSLAPESQMLTRCIVAIIVIVVVVVVAYVMINKPKDNNNNNSKRAIQFAGEIPVSNIYAQLKIPKAPSNGETAGPLTRFAGAGKSLAGRFVIPNADFDPSETATLPVIPAKGWTGPSRH